MIIRSKAPLRLGLAGGGTDVSPFSDTHGGYVLNATIDMYAYCTIKELDANRVKFIASDRGESFEDEAKSEFEIDDVLALHKGVYNRVVKDFNDGKPLPLEMVTYSDAPAGSGLGSSSTMVVAILKAYVEWLNLPLGEYDIAHLAFKIERVDIGLDGGKQDQYAATFGGFNFIEFYEKDRVIVNPLRIKNWIVNELEASLLLFFTGTSRDSAKIINEQKNSLKNTKSEDAMHELKNDATVMKEALLRGDMAKFAEYLGRSWEAKKRTSSAISNPLIDEVYDAALDAGAVSGKVSGAGGGGFMIFFVDPAKRLDVKRALERFDGSFSHFHFTGSGTQGWKIQ